MAADSRTRPTGAARWLVALAALLFALVVLLPVVAVFTEALRDGAAGYRTVFTHPHTVHALRLTGLIVAVVVPLNVAFGFAAAWLVTHFRFPGRGLLVTLIDLPFTVSPVVAGLMLVLLFGPDGWFGPWLGERGVAILFAPPGLILATMFVCVPIVARELMPAMQARGHSEELAALTLGASPLQMWWRVTVPGLRHALFAGTVLCLARAAGEYGAVAVVSGHVRGRTNTLSLHVDALYNDYQFVGAFAVASLLACVALLSLASSGGEHGVGSMGRRVAPDDELLNTHLHPRAAAPVPGDPAPPTRAPSSADPSSPASEPPATQPTTRDLP